MKLSNEIIKSQPPCDTWSLLIVSITRCSFEKRITQKTKPINNQCMKKNILYGKPGVNCSVWKTFNVNSRGVLKVIHK